MQQGDANLDKREVEPAANPEQQSNGSDESKSARKRKRAKKSKQRNAGNNSAPKSSDPPVDGSAQLPGSDNLGADGNQPNVPNGAKPHGKPSDVKDDMTYAEAAKSYCMAIIDQRTPGQMQLLNDEKFNKINALLTDIMFSSAGNSNVMPAFEDTRLHSGAMRLRCANEYTSKWLENTIPTLNTKKLWTGANLVLMAFKDIPKPYKFNVVVRSVNKPPKDIFVLLEKQNEGISTKSWTVLNHQKKNNDTYMTIGVGHDSFDALRGKSNTLYCGMGRAHFTIVKNCKENRNMLHSSANTNSTTAAEPPTTEQSGNNSNSEFVEQMDTHDAESVVKSPGRGGGTEN